MADKLYLHMVNAKEKNTGSSAFNNRLSQPLSIMALLLRAVHKVLLCYVEPLTMGVGKKRNWMFYNFIFNG